MKVLDAGARACASPRLLPGVFDPLVAPHEHKPRVIIGTVGEDGHGVIVQGNPDRTARLGLVGHDMRHTALEVDP